MVKIVSVKITTNYSWDDISNVGNWSAVRNTNNGWEAISTNTTTVGQPIKIEVEVLENTWGIISDLYTSWLSIKESFTSWLGLKNW